MRFKMHNCLRLWSTPGGGGGSLYIWETLVLKSTQILLSLSRVISPPKSRNTKVGNTFGFPYHRENFFALKANSPNKPKDTTVTAEAWLVVGACDLWAGMTAVTMEVGTHFRGKAVCVPQRQPDYQGAAKMQELTPVSFYLGPSQCLAHGRCAECEWVTVRFLRVVLLEERCMSLHHPSQQSLSERSPINSVTN